MGSEERGTRGKFWRDGEGWVVAPPLAGNAPVGVSMVKASTVAYHVARIREWIGKRVVEGKVDRLPPLAASVDELARLVRDAPAPVSHRDRCMALLGGQCGCGASAGNAPAGVAPADQSPVCPGPDCLLCNGQACDLCGAGLSTRFDEPRCEHDVTERHVLAAPPPPPVVPAGDVRDEYLEATHAAHEALGTVPNVFDLEVKLAAAEKRAEAAIIEARQEREAAGRYIADRDRLTADRDVLAARLEDLRAKAAESGEDATILPVSAARWQGREVAYRKAIELVAAFGTGAALGTGAAPAEPMVPAASVEALADVLRDEAKAWGIWSDVGRAKRKALGEASERLRALLPAPAAAKLPEGK